MLSATRPVALATALASALLLAGCGGVRRRSREWSPAVAAFYPLAWVTERVAGDDWTVENLTAARAGAARPRARPSPRPRPSRTPTWSSSSTASSRPSTRPSRNADDAACSTPPRSSTCCPPASEHERRARGETPRSTHDHGDLDPHFWLDPLLMADLADAVADELAEVDPDARGDVRRQRRRRCAPSSRPSTPTTPTGLAVCERDHDGRQPRGLRLPRALRAALRGRSPASPPTPSRRPPTWPGSRS